MEVGRSLDRVGLDGGRGEGCEDGKEMRESDGEGIGEGGLAP